MSAPRRQLILLVDALGWLTVERTRFLAERLPFRRRLTTVFGYSSTAVPSLLTGAWPVEHGHWFLFRRAFGRSPFREAGLVARLGGLGDRWRVRVRLQEHWRRRANIRGYFSLYNVPMSVLGELAPVEIADTWAPGAFPATPTLVDELARRGEPFHVSDWRVPDEEKVERAMAALDAGRPRTVLLYLTEIDSVQHRVGPVHPELDEALERLGGRVVSLLHRMERDGPVGVTLFSDHGMTPVTSGRDLLGALAAAGLARGRDYQGFFDSTVARFWNLRDRDRLERVLRGQSWGRILADHELREWGVLFPGRDYGDLLFLAGPGALILPSDMGRESLAAMHGYDPADPTSDACLLADRELPLAAGHITAVLPALKSRLEEGR